MKKLIFLSMASLFMFACSDNEDSPTGGTDGPQGNVTFEIAAVANLNNGFTRGNVYSQEATQHVTRVSVYAFQNTGSDYVYAKTYEIPGWTDGTAFKRYVVAPADTLPPGDYKFLAVGRDETDMFTVTDPAPSGKYSDMLAIIANSGDETELFAGTATMPVLENGSRISIEMTRQVAGVLGYFKNIPQVLNGVTVRYLRLGTSNVNQQVNLTTGAGINTVPTSYNIIDMDLSGQPVENGLYTGNDLSAQGVVKVANSQLSGSFLIPVSGVQLTLGLYDTNGNPLKTWTVKESSGAATHNIEANHFYALGIKAQAGNVNGGTADPNDDDDPIDLLTDQNIVITISSAWELIHNLVIQ